MRTIWIPDGAAISVQFYASNGKAVGVEKIDEDWVPHRVGEPRRAGFRSCWDPERDPPFDPLPRDDR